MPALELAAGRVIGGQVVGGQDDGLASESVAQGVQRRATLTLDRDGSGGMGRVLPIDFRSSV